MTPAVCALAFSIILTMSLAVFTPPRRRGKSGFFGDGQ